MKFSLSWLKEYLETDNNLDEILHWLTMVGLEVEKVEDQAQLVKDFVIGHIVDAKPHPDADRLKVLKVQTGTETLEVVCGAPNARADMKGIFACNGSYIPGLDVTLKTTKIRGITSNGMMLSEHEINLSDDHEGIIEVPSKLETGSSAAEALGLTDIIIDIAITPNRGDCLGIYGIARDLAAAGIGFLKPLEIPEIIGAFESPIKVNLDFNDSDKDACPIFTGRYIRNVKNRQSPQWLKDKILAVGLRPISALVDITNYMTIAHCRPLHVFDADKINGGINIRMARAEEKLLALDGKEYSLDETMTVIADNHNAEALAGVMGGEKSGVSEKTINVMLETAYFDPVRTATTGRKLNLQSDARYRFERGVDPAFLRDATEIATQMILDICGGEPSEVITVGQEPDWRRSYFLNSSRIKKLGGVEVAPDRTQEILEKLGFEVSKKDDGWETITPSWRYDIAGEADLVEEVLRINGYDNIPIVPLERVSSLPQGAINLTQDRRSRTRRTLAHRGLTEAVTFSFLSTDHANLFGGSPKNIELVNPISTDLNIMRPSILPNLINAISRNSDKGYNNTSLFEIGPQFSGENPDDENIVAAGIRSQQAKSRTWNEISRQVDVFDVKADVLAVLDQLGGPVANPQIMQGAASWYHPGKSGTFQLGPQKIIAYFGDIHPAILKAMNINIPMVAFEIYLDNAPIPKNTVRTKPPINLSTLQAVERDFAFVTEETIAAEQVVRAAFIADKQLIADVTVFDIFKGESVEAGKISIGITVKFQPKEATLTEEEIESICKKIISNVSKQTGGILRG